MTANTGLISHRNAFSGKRRKTNSENRTQDSISSCVFPGTVGGKPDFRHSSLWIVNVTKTLSPATLVFSSCGYFYLSRRKSDLIKTRRKNTVCIIYTKKKREEKQLSWHLNIISWRNRKNKGKSCKQRQHLVNNSIEESSIINSGGEPQLHARPTIHLFILVITSKPHHTINTLKYKIKEVKSFCSNGKKSSAAWSFNSISSFDIKSFWFHRSNCVKRNILNIPPKDPKLIRADSPSESFFLCARPRAGDKHSPTTR